PARVDRGSARRGRGQGGDGERDPRRRPRRDAPARRVRAFRNVLIRVFAPGRVNLIGEHTDYSGGLVLPVAIQLGVTLTGERGGASVRLSSAGFGDAAELTLEGEPVGTLPGWGRYVAAVVELVAPETGIDATIESTVPIGAGLSSSAALTVAVATALSSRPAL